MKQTGLVIPVLLLMLTVSCRSEEGENVSETKFVAIAQRQELLKFVGHLIKKVHNPKITIDYGFSDNNYCNGRFSDRKQQIKDSISKSLRVWLAPLADKGDIVDSFEYRHRKTHKAIIQTDFNHGTRRKFKYTLWVFGKPDMSIIFYCQLGRSYALSVTHPQIHMYKKREVKMGVVSDRKQYSLTTLHHEIGHAFGLGDTYVDPREESSWGHRYNVSDGGDTRTVGRQPISVMNLHYLAALDSARELQLGDDDIAGVKWLYNYHVAKTIDSNHCPADYLYEDSTQGCAPRYPLIFAVKQNNFDAVDRMLSDDLTIKLDQQDELGNTALHYAANAKKLHGGYLYDYLIVTGANTKLKNNKGETPQDLAGEKKNRENRKDSLLSLLIWQVSSPAVLRQIKYTLQQLDGEEAVKAAFGFPFVNINARAGERATLFLGKPPEDTVGYTLLHRAVIENELEIVKILLDLSSLDVNIQSKLTEETALHYAARFGRLEIAQLLLKHAEIDTELKDTWGKSPLARAMNEGQVEVWRAIKDSLND